jgi:cell division protein FtsI (penicillin-binding protein 3)
VDPATHAYSHTKYVASFAGFAPINNPAITVAVILDSAVGLHQGGQVSAPVFRHVAQQVLEYLHTPHDVELPRKRQLLLASRQVKEEDVAEGSPDHLGDPVDVAESSEGRAPTGVATPATTGSATALIPAALRQRETSPGEQAKPAALSPPVPESLPSSGTVVLDIEQAGIPVPSFAGKSVRAAIELAQENGLDLDAVGSGLAQEQFPSPGVRVPSGSKVTVKFGR